MSTPFIAVLLDHSLSLMVGALGTLIGFRILGPQPGSNEKFDSQYTRWIKHLKWIGPLLVALSSVQLVISIYSSNKVAVEEKSKKISWQTLQDSVSSEGKYAEQDKEISMPDGFRVMIPAGYTYLKPSGVPFSLVAVLDPDNAMSSVISVHVSRIEVSLEEAVESMKASLIEKNATTRFSETLYAGTRMVHAKRVKLYRTNVSSRRENGVSMKAEMAFFENEGRLFMLSCATRDELFQETTTTFERVISSFGPN